MASLGILPNELYIPYDNLPTPTPLHPSTLPPSHPPTLFLFPSLSHTLQLETQN